MSAPHGIIKYQRDVPFFLPRLLLQHLYRLVFLFCLIFVLSLSLSPFWFVSSFFFFLISLSFLFDFAAESVVILRLPRHTFRFRFLAGFVPGWREKREERREKRERKKERGHLRSIFSIWPSNAVRVCFCIVYSVATCWCHPSAFRAESDRCLFCRFLWSKSYVGCCCCWCCCCCWWRWWCQFPLISTVGMNRFLVDRWWVDSSCFHWSSWSGSRGAFPHSPIIQFPVLDYLFFFFFFFFFFVIARGWCSSRISDE